MISNEQLQTITSMIKDTTDTFWKIPVKFLPDGVVDEPVILGALEALDAEYIRTQHGDGYQQGYLFKVNQLDWDNRIAPGSAAVYAVTKYEVKSIKPTTQLLDTLLFVEVELVR